MLISEDASLSKYVIKAYSAEAININGANYSHSLIVTPEQLISDWRPRSLEDLTAEDLQVLVELKVEFVLLGTGPSFKLLPAELQKQFSDILIIETMSTPAACRSFIALSSEGRNIAAALIL